MIKKWKVCKMCKYADKEGRCIRRITPNAKYGKRRKHTMCFYFIGKLDFGEIIRL